MVGRVVKADRAEAVAFVAMQGAVVLGRVVQPTLVSCSGECVGGVEAYVTQTGVLDLRGAVTEGAAVGARQRELAPTVEHAQCPMRV